MPLMNGEHGYGAATKALHWLTFGLILGQFVVGYSMVRESSAADAAADRVHDAKEQCKATEDSDAAEAEEERCEEEVDRESLLRALSDFLQANNLKADWEGIENAPNEALVNALAMMSPYGTAEKQALLEAPDLKTRAEILVAATEIELAKKSSGGETPLQ